MEKYTSNSDRISENHISGINRVVKLDIVINRKTVKGFKHFRLWQSARKHHQFELILAHDSLEEIQNYNLEQAKKFLGTRITVTFNYKDPENKSPERNFVGVVTNVGFSQEEMSLGNIVLKGYSPSILMDSAPHTQSFGGNEPVNTAIIANNIIKETLGTSNFDFRVDAKFKGRIHYSSQYCETHYNYLARLAEAYGEQFYYDGEILHFGNLPAHEKRIQLTDKSNVTNVRVDLEAIHTKPEFFGYNSSSHEKMESFNNPIKHLGDLSSQAYELNNNIFKTRSLMPSPLNPNMYLDVNDSQKSAMGSAAVEVMKVSGNTSIPFLYIGCVADIAMRKPDTNKSEHFTTLMITEAYHEVDARGYYTGSFEGIAEGTGFMPKPDFIMPKAEQQVATVISNVDPLNQGRIQVRFDWQGIADSTYFIRMMSPDAGGSGLISQNRGFVAIPEVGDQVMVGFEYHHPDFPFAMGAMFHGKIGLGGGNGNRIRSIQSPDGHRLVLTEGESILLADKKTNEIKLDTEGGNLNITSPGTITIKAKNLKFDIEEDIDTKAGKNMDTNVGQNIKIIARQEISQDSGKKTIINAGTNTEISAKAHLDLYGKEKFIGYTDGQTEFGAKDRMHVYGANSLLTAKDKIEYKAPQMNKLPQNGEFDYTKEKQIVSAQWMDADMNKEITMASYDEEISLLVYTRNYEEGESITLTVYEVDDKDINNGEKEITLTGNVKKDGFAELKRSVKVEKQQA